MMPFLAFAALVFLQSAFSEASKPKTYRLQLFMETDGTVLEFPTTELTPGTAKKIRAQDVKKELFTEITVKLTEEARPMDPATLEMRLEHSSAGLETSQNLPSMAIHRGEIQDVILSGVKSIRLKTKLLADEANFAPVQPAAPGSIIDVIPVTDLRPKDSTSLQ